MNKDNISLPLESEIDNKIQCSERPLSAIEGHLTKIKDHIALQGTFLEYIKLKILMY